MQKTKALLPILTVLFCLGFPPFGAGADKIGNWEGGDKRVGSVTGSDAYITPFKGFEDKETTVLNPFVDEAFTWATDSAAAQVTVYSGRYSVSQWMGPKASYIYKQDDSTCIDLWLQVSFDGTVWVRAVQLLDSTTGTTILTDTLDTGSPIINAPYWRFELDPANATTNYSTANIDYFYIKLNRTQSPALRFF